MDKMEEKMNEKELDKKLSKVVFWPGSINSYIDFVGYDVKVIDTNKKNKGVLFGCTDDDPFKCLESPKLKDYLVKSGIEAIVECNFSQTANNLLCYSNIYGLPVKRP